LLKPGLDPRTQAEAKAWDLQGQYQGQDL